MSGPSSVARAFSSFTVRIEMTKYSWSDDAEADARAHEEEEQRLAPFLGRVGKEVQLELERACRELSRFELVAHSEKLFQFALEYGPHPRDHPQRKNNPCRVLFRLPVTFQGDEVLVFIDVALARMPEVKDLESLAEQFSQGVGRARQRAYGSYGSP
ncbi:MAG: hypothetical protein ACOZIN_11940 [Myxococcota bacterium]